MNKTHCTMAKNGLFVSHRGVGLCCISSQKQKIKPSEFWYGHNRKEAIQNMQEEKEVKGCDVCYRNEKKNTPSSRLFYNSYNNIASKDLPTILDLDLTNFCNLKCVMCNPARSSEWAKDVDDSKDGIRSISQEYIDDLIKISDEVVHLTIQGGEPSIMKEYEYYFEALERKKIIENIDIQIITNATNVNSKFYRLLEKFKSVRLSVSLDAFGKANNYIRWPSNFEQIEKNLLKMSDLKNTVRVEILNSLNILSMFNFKEFLFWCKKMEGIYDAKDKYFGVVPMKVVRPEKYSPFSAPLQLKEKYIADVKEFISTTNLSHNVNWKTETMMMLNRIKKSQTDHTALSDLMTDIQRLDSQRKVTISDYIPDFDSYL